MGSELVTTTASPSNKSFTEIFYEAFPFYLSIGMTYDLYWNGDCALVKYYRKAFEMQLERENYRANYNAWLQGAYIYDALCAVSPILQAFAKRGTKPTPYHKEPYPMKKEMAETETDKPKQDIQALNASARFSAFAVQFNKKFKEGGRANGNNDRPT